MKEQCARSVRVERPVRAALVGRSGQPGAFSTKSYNLSGLAPFGGAGWVSGLKSFSQEGKVTFVKVTTGVAYGVAGWVCYSGNPSASR